VGRDNYSFKKRQRELDQKKKREEKLQRKLDKKNPQTDPIQVSNENTGAI
jgi:hypothetical protein